MLVSATAASRAQVVAVPASLRVCTLAPLTRLAPALALGSALEQLEPSPAVGFALPVRVRDDADRLAGGQPLDLSAGLDPVALSDRLRDLDLERARRRSTGPPVGFPNAAPETAARRAARPRRRDRRRPRRRPAVRGAVRPLRSPDDRVLRRRARGPTRARVSRGLVLGRRSR